MLILLQMIPNRILARIAVGGGFIALGSASYFRSRIETAIKRSEYFELAVKQLKSSNAAAVFLGEPIIVGTPDLGDTKKNFCDGLLAKFTVPVRGPKDSGSFAFEAFRSAPGEHWTVGDIDLFLNKEPDRKLIIHSKAPESDEF